MRLPSTNELLRNEDHPTLEVIRGHQKRVQQLEGRASVRTALANAANVHIIVGTGSPFNIEDPFTGTAMLYPPFEHSTGNYHIIGMNAGTLEFGLSADDGKAYFAGGTSIIDEAGITLRAGAYPATAYLLWKLSDGTLMGSVDGWDDSGSSTNGIEIIGSAKNSSYNGTVYLIANDHAGNNEGVFKVQENNIAASIGLTTAGTKGTRAMNVASYVSTTNDINTVVYLDTYSTGTPANFLGSALGFRTENSTPAIKDQGYLGFEWTDVTAASEDANAVIGAMVAGTLTTVFKASGSGTTLPFGVDVTNGHVRSATVTLNDDAATSFTPTKASGVMIFGGSGGDTTVWGVVGYATATPQTGAFSVGSNLNVTTGTLAGTTGTDTKFTVSAHTDGKLYFENRRGGTRQIFIILI